MNGNKKVIKETVVMEKAFLASYDQPISSLVSGSIGASTPSAEPEEYPSCTLHPNYFALALHQLGRTKESPALSISSEWDNREILKVIRKQ